jgi:monovalent cation:H+ antiporter-2, CPA2 family
MSIAGVMMLLCQRFKQPIVLGYIVAGIIIGPYTPPFSFISDEETIKTLAELGVVFLMFSLGLEFNLHKLKRVGVVAFIAAFAEITLMMWLGYEIGRFFHWETIDAIFLGAILAISSTTIIIKALNDLGMKHKPFAQLIFGVLIVEDIFAILILTLLAGIALTGSLQFQAVVVNVMELSSFLVVSLLIGLLVVPKLLTYIAKYKSDEVMLISILGLCFGFCLMVAKLEYSVALGAFIMGAVIAESKQLHKIEHLISPIRDMFSAIFFVSVGLLFDPGVIVNYWVPIVFITIAVIVGKVLTCSLGVLITGRDGKTALKTGMGLAQIGEFSFIIASLGITLNVTSDFLYPMAVAISVITTLTTPYLIKNSDSVANGIKAIIPEKVSVIFNWYRTWLRNIRPIGGNLEVTHVINRSLLQVAINLFVVMAIFLSAAYMSTTSIGVKLWELTNLDMEATILWGGALFLSLPSLIAVYRKMKALAMILSEYNVKADMGKHLSLHVRRAIAQMIPAMSIISILVFVSALSASILPPLHLLVIVIIIAAILIGFLFPWCIKLHAHLQVNLIDALNHKDKG